ncbi:hypothetical protein ABVT39_018283 [Epinephelus coioides]
MKLTPPVHSFGNEQIHCVSYTPSAPHLWYRQPTRLRLKVRIRFQPSSVPTARKTSNSNPLRQLHPVSSSPLVPSAYPTSSQGPDPFPALICTNCQEDFQQQ